MKELSRFPKGLWYEVPRRRYRVRKYHNQVVYGPWYFRTLDGAMAKLSEVNQMIALIPKAKRQYAPTTEGEQ
jgi:hypothetical protein